MPASALTIRAISLVESILEHHGMADVSFGTIDAIQSALDARTDIDQATSTPDHTVTHDEWENRNG